ncbi:MAG: DUF481 domain-containing protein [Pseudomonadota bacterium]
MTFSQTLKLAAATAALGMTLPAFAQDETEGWTGEGSLSAGVTTGNTETTDLGLGVDVGRDFGVWAVGAKASADYGETDGAETKNRIFLGGNVDRQINDKLFGFGQASYEKDEFSGFESRAYLGGGLGYEIFSSDQLGWVVRGGPGLKLDEVLNPDTGEVDTEESLGASAESNFNYTFNDNVGFTNDTTVLYAETSTQISNIAALTASLTDTLSARISFEVRHDTDPVEGFEATDTISRVSLVYAFGN